MIGELIVGKLLAVGIGLGTLFVGGVLAVVSDPVAAAAIAGVFSVLNTVLAVVLVREQRHVRRVLTAPRRMVYDQTGAPIGTVLDLRTDGWLTAAVGRRTGDPTPTSSGGPPV